MANDIPLPLVYDPDPARDTIVEAGTPMLSGADNENLVCGACKSIVARNVATRSLYERNSSESGRLLIKCDCGAFNKANVRRTVDT